MTEETKHAPISDERLAEILTEAEVEIANSIADADADQNPQLAINPVAEFSLAEVSALITELQERRAHSLPSAVTDEVTIQAVSKVFSDWYATEKGATTGAKIRELAISAIKAAALSLLIAQPAEVSKGQTFVDRVLDESQDQYRRWLAAQSGEAAPPIDRASVIEECAKVAARYADQFPAYPEFDASHNAGREIAIAIRALAKSA